MLGASAFLADPHWRARVGVVINLEARGNQGRSFLFQTSAGDAALVDLYAQAVPHLATSSLYAEIYKILPNDTDLTPFLKAGFTGYNFAFVGECGALSHTAGPAPKSRSARPAAAWRSGAGAAAGAVDKEISQRSKAAMRSISMSWACGCRACRKAGRCPFAVGLCRHRAGGMVHPERLAALAAAADRGGGAAGFAAGCGGSGISAARHRRADLSGEPDPSFAHPWALRLALIFGVWAVALRQPGLGLG